MKRFSKFYFLVVILLLFVVGIFFIKDLKNNQVSEEMDGPGLACIYLFNTDYKVEDLAAIELSGGDHKAIKSWNQQLGMFEKVQEGQYLIYDYLCDREYFLNHFLINLRKENYANIEDYKMELVHWDTYKDFYYCEADEIGIGNYEINKIKSMIDDKSIYNHCEKLK